MDPDIHSIEISDENESKKYYWKFHFLWSFFTISGADRVKREALTREDFYLPDQTKVAKYDDVRVARYWNETNVKQRMWRQYLNKFAYGLFIKLIPVIIIYLAIHYATFFTLYPYYECAMNNTVNCTGNKTSTPHNNTGKNTTTLHNNTGKICTIGGWPNRITSWKELATTFSRILTFFIGFFVGLLFRGVSFFQ